LFEGVDLTWKRVAGGEAVARALADARKAWDPQAPHLMLPALAKARRAIATLGGAAIVGRKRAEIDELLRACGAPWLEAIAESRGGSFQLDDPAEALRPENEPAFLARFIVRIAGERIVYDVPVANRWVDRVQGERYRDLVIVPPATLRFEEDVYVFPLPGAA